MFPARSTRNMSLELRQRKQGDDHGQHVVEAARQSRQPRIDPRCGETGVLAASAQLPNLPADCPVRAHFASRCSISFTAGEPLEFPTQATITHSAPGNAADANTPRMPKRPMTASASSGPSDGAGRVHRLNQTVGRAKLRLVNGLGHHHVRARLPAHALGKSDRTKRIPRICHHG